MPTRLSLVAGAVLACSSVLGAADLATASRLAAQGRLEEAERMLVALEKSDPRGAEVKYRLGLVLLRRGKLREAESRLDRAAKLSPKSPLVWLALAQLRLRQDDVASAERAAGEARSLAGGDRTVAQALLLFEAEVIRHHLAAGRAQAAEELARRAMERENAAVFHHLLARALAARGNPAAAVEEFQVAIRMHPDQPEYYADLASLFLDHRTPEPAGLVLAAAARRFPKHAGLVRLEGVTALGRGDIGRALDAFLRAIDLDPDHEGGYASLETLIPQAGDRLLEIVKRLGAFAERHPESPAGHYLLALASPEGAEERLRRAIRAAPEFWPAQFALHTILKDQGKAAEAAEALKRVIAVNPDYAPAHFGLAQLYARLGDREGARREREVHHKLVSAQQAEEDKRRELAPRLSYRLSER